VLLEPDLGRSASRIVVINDENCVIGLSFRRGDFSLHTMTESGYKADWIRESGVNRSPAQVSGRVLVTGGAGNLGSELVADLVSGGHDVTVVDNLQTGTLANLDGISEGASFKFVRADLCEPEKYASQVRD